MIWTFVLGVLVFGTATNFAIESGLYALCYGAAGTVTLLLLILFVFILPRLRWIRWRYAVLDDEIDIYRGIIVRKRIIVPLIRVQYTDTSQGPLLRAFGLASVNVSTAGGDQSIPGLLANDANELRDRVANLAKQVHEDV